MKNFSFTLLAFSLLFLASCSSGGGLNEKVVGKWKLTSFTDKGEDIELKDCDNQTVWNFKNTKAEPMGDETEVYELEATTSEGCKWFDFESKWTMKEGKLFISTSRIGGMGGSSLAGAMELVSLDDNNMEWVFMKKKLVFEKL